MIKAFIKTPIFHKYGDCLFNSNVCMNCSLCTHHNFNMEIHLFIRRKSNQLLEIHLKIND